MTSQPGWTFENYKYEIEIESLHQNFRQFGTEKSKTT